MLDIRNSKSPGLDGFGFGFGFFRSSWNVVGNDVIVIVNEFFSTSKFPTVAKSCFLSLGYSILLWPLTIGQSLAVALCISVLLS